MYLNKLEVVEDLPPLKTGLQIEFKSPICFLVGDNGVGKSTILDCLGNHYKFADETYFKRSDSAKHIKVEEEESIKVKFIDFHGDDRKFAGSFGSDLGLQMAQMRLSSGQVTISLLNKLGSISNSLILLDEPERGLSIKNQWKVAQIISGLVKIKNCQIVVTSHSDIILKSCKDNAQYFSVANNADITYEDFMLEQLS